MFQNKLRHFQAIKLISIVREPLLKDRLCTVDLLVLTCSDQPLSNGKHFLHFYIKATLMRRSIVLKIPLQLVFPVCAIS